jgi:hypothetical protein
MTMNHNLAKQIEVLVRQHVDTLRTAAAAAAIARAFATALPRKARPAIWRISQVPACRVGHRKTAQRTARWRDGLLDLICD